MTEARPDLSARTALSKSALTTFEWCQTEAWYEIRDRRAFIPSEPTVFGSAVDRGVEVYIAAARAGIEPDDVDLDARAWDAAEVLLTESDIEVDQLAVSHALLTFGRDIIPTLDWTGAITQHHINLPLDELGECDGHPDVILGRTIVDIKTGSPKQTARTTELGFYALLREAETGEPVDHVGYLFYNRKLVNPKWGRVFEPVTDEFRRWAYETAASYVRAKRADEVLNRRAEIAGNYTFPGGPAWPGKCAGCAYSPANGGPCVRAYREDAA